MPFNYDSNQFLFKQEPKLAFDFSQEKQYDYEAQGNDVVVISPSNVTLVLRGEQAQKFWMELDHIETEYAESPLPEYNRAVQSLISLYFERDSKAASARYVIQVDATAVKKSSLTFISGVDYEKGSISKLRFTTNRSKAAQFSCLAATEIHEKLGVYGLTGSVKPLK